VVAAAYIVATAKLSGQTAILSQFGSAFITSFIGIALMIAAYFIPNHRFSISISNTFKRAAVTRMEQFWIGSRI